MTATYQHDPYCPSAKWVQNVIARHECTYCSLMDAAVERERKRQFPDPFEE